MTFKLVVFLRGVSVMLLLAALAVAGAVSAQNSVEIQISRYEWPTNDAADTMLRIPQLKRAVNILLQSDSSHLVIRYPGGDEGNEWAIDLRDNLVSLGIESSIVRLEPGSGIEETLLVIVSENS